MEAHDYILQNNYTKITGCSTTNLLFEELSALYICKKEEIFTNTVITIMLPLQTKIQIIYKDIYHLESFIGNNENPNIRFTSESKQEIIKKISEINQEIAHSLVKRNN